MKKDEKELILMIDTSNEWTWKNSKSYLKPKQGIYIAGNIIFDSKANRQTPPPQNVVLQKGNREFPFWSKIFALFGISAQGGLT